MSKMFADDRPRRGGRPWARGRDISVAERLADEGLLPDESRGLLPRDSGHLLPDSQVPQFLTVSEFATLLTGASSPQRANPAANGTECDHPGTKRENYGDADLVDALKGNLLKSGTHQIDESHKKAFERVLLGMRLECKENGATNGMRTAVSAACRLETKLDEDGATLTKVFRDNREQAHQIVAALDRLPIQQSEMITLPSKRDVGLLKDIFFNLHGDTDLQHGPTDAVRLQESGPAGQTQRGRQFQMS